MNRSLSDQEGGFSPDLLPHGQTARLVHQVVRSEPTLIDVVCIVPAEHPLASEGRAPAFLGLEMGAQAAATLEAIGRRRDSGAAGPRIGYLVRVSEATFLAADLPTEAALDVSARLEGSAPPLAIYRISVSQGGIELLNATLSTYCEGPNQ